MTSAWTVTVQAGAFLAVLVLPTILIRGGWDTPATAGLVAGLMAAMRQSRFHYQRFRLS